LVIQSHADERSAWQGDRANHEPQRARLRSIVGGRIVAENSLRRSRRGARAGQPLTLPERLATARRHGRMIQPTVYGQAIIISSCGC
jgi:hypothetical protein